MNEEEFDSRTNLRPFGTKDAMRMDAQWGRIATLGQQLWGRTPEDLQRQLVAVHPAIPPNFPLEDFRHLLERTQTISVAMESGKFAWASSSDFLARTVIVGNQRYTEWEARCEIVRRAIDFLERLH